MANPRQRRKARSGSHSAVKQSRRAKKNLRKHPAIKGPKALQDAWDKKKTVKQNHGPGTFPESSAQGGTEKILVAPNSEPNTTSTLVSQPKPIPQGRGRIIRDENGTVIGIELPEEPEAPVVSQKGKGGVTWGEAMDDSDEEAEKMISPEALSWALGSIKKRQEGGCRALEKLSAFGVKTQRHASMHEVVWLKELVAAHGTDIAAMAHDLKRNVWQKTLENSKER
ncbi:Ribosome biogenesis protein Nop16 [Rhizoctonia solani]|uniref:Nucleolar protein 16 n=1 Tax=Rhizoctonia solani TaxID=456999 RepID=A0A8H7M0U6_9AGAM|nr:Ribosome biogenesis protein Nop16 [Rhizoctonia solani]